MQLLCRELKHLPAADGRLLQDMQAKGSQACRRASDCSDGLSEQLHSALKPPAGSTPAKSSKRASLPSTIWRTWQARRSLKLLPVVGFFMDARITMTTYTPERTVQPGQQQQVSKLCRAAWHEAINCKQSATYPRLRCTDCMCTLHAFLTPRQKVDHSLSSRVLRAGIAGHPNGDGALPFGTGTVSLAWALAVGTSDRVFDSHVLNHECLGLVAHLLHNLWVNTQTLHLQVMPITNSARRHRSKLPDNGRGPSACQLCGRTAYVQRRSGSRDSAAAMIMFLTSKWCC